jgi:hypothetical protein
MSAGQFIREFETAPGSVVGLTIEQYHLMIDQGMLDDRGPIELLDGFMVRKDRSRAGGDPMSIGDDHFWAVENLRRALREVEPLGHIVLTQQPVVLPPDGEPEPDGMVVRGTLDDYLGRKPVAADLSCVIEVADSSLNRDRTTKHRIYADAGIVQYLIVNLVDRAVEVYERPVRGQGRYEDVRPLTGDEAVAVLVGGTRVGVEARRFLPRQTASR